MYIITGQEQQMCDAVHLVQKESALSLLSRFIKAGPALHLDSRMAHTNLHA